MSIHMQTLFVPYKRGGGPPTCLLTTDAEEPIVAPFTVTITFSREVTGFTVDDIDAINAALSDFAGSGDTYTVTVTPDWAGAVTVSVPAGVTTPANLASNTLALEIGEASFTDDFAAADPATNGWYSPGGGAIANVGGALVITPTLDTEIFTNGNMETGDPPAGWVGTNATLSAAADERTGGAGVQSLQLTNNLGGANGRAENTIGALTIGRWLRVALWQKRIDSTSFFWLSGPATTPNIFLQNTSLTWAAYLAIARVTNAGTAANTARITQNQTGLGVVSRADDVSARYTILNTAVALRDFDFAYGAFTLPLTRTALTQCGLLLNYEDIDNFAVVYQDGGGNIVYGKVQAGVWANVGSYAAAYAAAAPLVVTRHQDGTMDITYNAGALVVGGAASGLTGLTHGVFMTYPNQAHSFNFDIAGVT